MTALYCSDFSLRGATDSGFGLSIVWDVDVLSGYRAVFLGQRARRRTPRGFWSLVTPEIWMEIRSGRYDAIWLHGYSYAAFVIAFLAAKSRRLPVFMRSETHLLLKRPAWRRRVRDAILSFAYKYVDAFLAIGTANRDYYLSLGIPAHRIFHVPYTVDNDRFISAAKLSTSQRRDVRRVLGLPDQKPIILFASKFTRRKHPQDVLVAASMLKKRGCDFAVLMVGSGEMDLELKELANRLGLTDVVFAGFVNQSELPKIYAASDVFVLPSEDEPWGLIVNEVMCAGLPVVVSDEAGCAADLVIDGDTGRKMKAGDPNSLAQVIEPLLNNPEMRRAMGERGLELIAGWSYAECLTGVRAACKETLA